MVALREGENGWDGYVEKQKRVQLNISARIATITMECESDDVATDHEGGASFSINFGPDDFCSYGQRKEADHG